jgi:hypothetical protein
MLWGSRQELVWQQYPHCHTNISRQEASTSQRGFDQLRLGEIRRNRGNNANTIPCSRRYTTSYATPLHRLRHGQTVDRYRVVLQSFAELSLRGVTVHDPKTTAGPRYPRTPDPAVVER